MQTGAISKEWACKEMKIPLKSLCGHLPEVHFHTPIQKVRGYVGGFTELRRDNNQVRNTLLSPGSQGGNSIAH